MNGIRPPVAAGYFYPADATALAETVDRLLGSAHSPAPAGELRAIIVPHAGYVYSGAAAAAAFAAIRRNGRLLRVALLGPSHFVPLRRVAVSGARAWRTPLGVVPVDLELRSDAVAAGAVVDDGPHVHDHALEVELPFLQRRVGDALRLLPVAVGGEAGKTAAVVAALAPRALIVVSSDLSHYLDAAGARTVDRRTAESVVALDDQAIGDRDACGVHALRGLLAHARGAGWTCTLLDLRTSADATGDRDRVVGYGAFALTGA